MTKEATRSEARNVLARRVSEMDTTSSQLAPLLIEKGKSKLEAMSPLEDAALTDHHPN